MTEGSIAICITTTRERQEIYERAYENHLKYMPQNAKIITVYNTSPIAAAKNKCLEMAGDADHIFLFDDDTWPIIQNWWKPYIEAGEPHLMYQFKLSGKPANNMQETFHDDKLIAYTHTRGAMLYVHSSVLETVGGFDTKYINGFEHPDYTNRIHNAGLTTYRAMDVIDSDQLLYCLDQDDKVESTIIKDPQQDIANFNRYRLRKQSKKYKEYRS